MRYDLFWKKGSLHVDRSGSSHTRIEIRKGKAAGKNEIRLEMLKALNGEGVHWLTRVCQVAWKLRKTPKDR